MILHIYYKYQKHRHEYLCMIELLLQWDLRLCFMNYNCVSRKYDCDFHDKIVLFVKRKLQLFIEESKYYHT